MSTSNHNLDSQFDRLVDGELSPAEYRALLASLDDQPEGWRRCALAFLEAQALGRDLSAIRQPVAPAPGQLPNEPAQLPPERPGDWSHRSSQGLYFATIAASLALAFYVGSWTSDWNGPSLRQVAQQPPTPSTSDDSTLPGDKRPSLEAPSSIARNDTPLGNVRLVMDGGEKQQRVDVPVYSTEQADQWHSVSKPVLPPQVIQQLERSGHKIEHQQRYILLDTEDGKQVLVPVDNYQIQPPRGRAY